MDIVSLAYEIEHGHKRPPMTAGDYGRSVTVNLGEDGGSE